MTDFVIDCLKISTEVSFVMLLLLFATIVCTLVCAKILKKSDGDDEDLKELKLKNVTSEYQKIKKHMQNAVFSEKELEEVKKEEKAKQKEAKKKKSKDGMNNEENKHRVFVIDFEGDLKATGVKTLANQITAVLTVAELEDEVIVNITSPGGAVYGYGLAASQLARVREKGIRLTACVDKVAASGGYMMACIANKIVSAPFAIVGSVGVVAEFPNFYRLLKKCNIDYEQETAGEFKRTLSMLGDNSDPKAREKFRAELEECHILFKNHVSRYRPQLDIEKIATGEHWYGSDAFKEHLVDEISTSDEYILSRIDKADVYRFAKKEKKKTIVQKLVGGVQDNLSSMVGLK